MAIKHLKVAETKSRIVVVYEKVTGDENIDGIYKIDVDKENNIPNVQSIVLTNYESKLVPISLYGRGAAGTIDRHTKLIELVGDTTKEQVGIIFTCSFDDESIPRDDSLWAGKILGDIFDKCPLTPLTNLGTVHDVTGKFRSDGTVNFFYNRTKSDGTDELDWLGGH